MGFFGDLAFKTAVKKGLLAITEHVEYFQQFSENSSLSYGEALKKWATIKNIRGNTVCNTWEGLLFFVVFDYITSNLVTHPKFRTDKNYQTAREIIGNWVVRYGGKVSNMNSDIEIFSGTSSSCSKDSTIDLQSKFSLDGCLQSRVLCGDGRCIGIIDKNGRCTECGKTLEETREVLTKDEDETEPIDLKNRTLSSDGNLSEQDVLMQRMAVALIAGGQSLYEHIGNDFVSRLLNKSIANYSEGIKSFYEEEIRFFIWSFCMITSLSHMKAQMLGDAKIQQLVQLFYENFEQLDAKEIGFSRQNSNQVTQRLRLRTMAYGKAWGAFFNTPVDERDDSHELNLILLAVLGVITKSSIDLTMESLLKIENKIYEAEYIYKETDNLLTTYIHDEIPPFKMGKLLKAYSTPYMEMLPMVTAIMEDIDGATGAILKEFRL